MIYENNKKKLVRRLSAVWIFVFLFSGSFLFGGTSSAAMTGDYNKSATTNNTLSAFEWNNLVNDFLTANGGRVDGPVGINTATSSSYALDVNGSIRSTTFIGSYTGVLNAGNISAGDFGSNTAGGNFSFGVVKPGNLGIGIVNPAARFAVQATSTNDIINLFDNTGAEKMTVFNSGNVGIGTTNPGTYKLNVAGTAKFTGSVDTDVQFLGQASDTVSAPSFAWTGDLTTGMWRPAASTIAWSAAGSEKMRLTSTGNLGIGTTGPSYPLVVNKIDAGVGNKTVVAVFGRTGAAMTGTPREVMISFTDSANPTAIAGISGIRNASNADYNGSLGFYVNNSGGGVSDPGGMTRAMTILNTGNVGIGTASPQYKLDVNGNIGTNYSSLILNPKGGTVGTDGTYGVYWNQSAGVPDSNYGIYRTPGAWTASTYQQLKMSFTTGIIIDGGSAYTKSGTIIQPNGGNVGIGTTTPAYKLDVNGAGNFHGNAIHGVGTPLAGDDATTKSYVDSIVAPSSTVPIGTQSGFWTAGASNSIYNANSGSVGVGTTNPGYQLEVAGASAASSIYNTNSGVNDVPLYFRSAFAGLLNTSDILGTILGAPNDSSGGRLVFSTVAGASGGGTAGTLYERMRIDSAGNVGIGTNNPQYKLDVNGIVNATSLYVNGSPYIGSQWVTNASNIYYNLGNVGIGTTTPSFKLDVRGAIASNFDQPVFVGTPTATGHAATKSYVDSVLAGGSGSTVGYWTMSGTNISNSNGGNVGINITNPLSRLAIKGTGNTNTTSALDVQGNDGGSHLFVRDDGNVGIGTTNPAGKLWVPDLGDNNQIQLGTLTLNGSGVSGYTGSMLWANWNPNTATKQVGGWSYGIDMGRNGDFFSINNIPTGSTSVSSLMRILGNGNVGIGTTIPSFKLDVRGAIASNFDQPVFVGTPTATGHAATKNYVDSALAGGSGSTVGYWTMSGTNISNSNGGNVGIGTTAPGNKLDVEYSNNSPYSIGGNISGITSAGSAYFRNSQADAVFSAISLSTRNAGASVWSMANVWQDNAKGDLTFVARDDWSTSREVLRLKSGGNVGIGTTDPGAYKLYVNGDTNINGTLTATGLTSTVQARNVTNGEFGVTGGGGNFIFGATVPGNVGIGTTGPVAKLHIAGSDGAWSSSFKGNLNVAGAADNSLSIGSYSASPFGVWLQAGDNRVGQTSSYPLLLQPIGGNVGIGTTGPGKTLTVNGDIALYNSSWADKWIYGGPDYRPIFGNSGHLKTIVRAIDNDVGDGVDIQNYSGTSLIYARTDGNVGIGSTNPTEAKLVINAGTGNMALKAIGNGIFTGTLQTQTGSDFAEEFATTQDLEPGTVVVMDNAGYKSVRPCTKSYDKTVVGIVSNNPSIIAGRITSEHKAIIAMMGVVKVKASDINGGVAKGDLLTTSGIKGYAMKAVDSKPGTVIGKALEDLSGPTGEINVLVNLQ